MAGKNSDNLTWVVRTEKRIEVHVHGEDYTTMALLQDALTRHPGVALASCAPDELGHKGVVHVLMTPESSQTAERAVQEALRAMQRTCEVFARLARKNIPSFAAPLSL